MESIKNCDRCGNVFKGERCECGAEWAQETAKLAYEAFKYAVGSATGEAVEEAFVRAEEKKVANLRRALWQTLHTEEKYFKGKDVVSWANEILEISPSAVDAQFYSMAGDKRWKDVRKYLNKITQNYKAEKHLRYVEDFVRFLTNPWAGKEIEIALKGLINKAFSGTEKEKELYAIIENARTRITDFTMERDVFVAYSSADLGKVYELVEALEGNGLTCFVSDRDSTQGLDANLYYERDLEDAINHSKVFVFVSTKNSRDKEICVGAHKELEYIRERDLERVPAKYRAKYEADYGMLDCRYKKPRVEWVVDKYPATIAKGSYDYAVTHQYFGGFTRAYSIDDVLSKINQVKNFPFGNISVEEEKPPKKIKEPKVKPPKVKKIKPIKEEVAVTKVEKPNPLAEWWKNVDKDDFWKVIYWIFWSISMASFLFLAVYTFVENGNFVKGNTQMKVWTAFVVLFFVAFAICLLISLIQYNCGECKIIDFHVNTEGWIICLSVSGGLMAVAAIPTLYSATIASGFAWKIVTLILVAIMLLTWISHTDGPFWSFAANISIAFWVLLFAIFTPIQAKYGYDGIWSEGFVSCGSYIITEDGVELYLRKNGDEDYYVPSKTIKIPSEIKGLPVVKVGTCDKVKKANYVTSIIFPDTVKDISGFDFEHFYNLTSVDFGGVLSIPETDFAKTKISEVTIPASVEAVEERAFYGCKNLKTVTFEEGSALERIGDYAFAGCTSLTSLDIPASVSEIGGTGAETVFEGVGLTTLTVQEGNLFYRAIDNCLIQGKNLVLGLENCTLPTDSKVNRIEARAFWGKKIASIHIPANITAIDDEAFYGVYGLEALTVAEENPRYSAVGNCLIDKTTKTLVAGCKYSEIPTDGSVVEIGKYAFSYRLDMVSLIIPLDIVKVHATSFLGCEALTVYCKAQEKPETWEDFWTGNVKKIIWDYSFE